MHMRSILPGGCTHFGWTRRTARPGQILVCEIVGVAADGYDIFIPQFNQRGHLFSREKPAVGDCLCVTYLFMEKGKMQTTERRNTKAK